LAQIQREKFKYDRTKLAEDVPELLGQLSTVFNDILYPVHIQELKQSLEQQFGLESSTE
jgi:hypothetical protein